MATVKILLSGNNKKVIGNAGSKEEIVELTVREISVLSLLAEGFSNKEIGKQLEISHRTADTHRTNIMKKLKMKNVITLVRFAIENDLLKTNKNHKK
jgi:DNA-binding NarL/FixJ family response regulator